MCSPLAAGLLSFGVQAAQSVAQYSAGVQDSKNVAEASSRAFTDEQRQSSLRQIQEADAAAQKAQLSDIEQAEAEAEVQAGAAESGVAGPTVDNLVADITRRGARNRQTISENTRMIVAQLQQEKKGSRSQNQSRINATPRPSPFSLVAGLAGAGLEGFNTYNKFMS